MRRNEKKNKSRHAHRLVLLALAALWSGLVGCGGGGGDAGGGPGIDMALAEQGRRAADEYERTGGRRDNGLFLQATLPWPGEGSLSDARVGLGGGARSEMDIYNEMALGREAREQEARAARQEEDAAIDQLVRDAEERWRGRSPGSGGIGLRDDTGG